MRRIRGVSCKFLYLESGLVEPADVPVMAFAAAILDAAVLADVLLRLLAPYGAYGHTEMLMFPFADAAFIHW
jgi:hypothetical protein